MTTIEFLNVAHATLVEEMMRTRMVRGVTISGLPLDEALAAAAPWAEGYVEALASDSQETENRGRDASAERSEAEIVEQNERAMQQFQAMMGNTRGGLTAKG